jgi:hypothetical protein
MGKFRSLAVSLTLVAMLLRGFMPMGWMPDAQGAGFTICSIDGAHRTAPADQPGKQDHGDSVCPFAAAAHLAPPVLAALSLPVRSAGFALLSSQPLSVAAAFARHNPQSPRAPPFPA